ncbi:MAG: hypothetical protein E7A38_02825 [Leclercia adecarboxylata]|nr:hypothetical protein [Leclercia adecarboxylata]
MFSLARSLPRQITPRCQQAEQCQEGKDDTGRTPAARHKKQNRHREDDPGACSGINDGIHQGLAIWRNGVIYGSGKRG